jgi:hypothetical protein
MYEIVNSIFSKTGLVRRETCVKFFGVEYPSRGFYICGGW